MITKTIFHPIQEQTSRSPDALAIMASDRKSLTYRGLYDQVQTTISRLNELGVGRNDRVVIVLPNGPEMATAFLSIASAATSAPLASRSGAPRVDRSLHLLVRDDSSGVRVGKSALNHAVEDELLQYLVVRAVFRHTGNDVDDGFLRAAYGISHVCHPWRGLSVTATRVADLVAARRHRPDGGASRSTRR